MSADKIIEEIREQYSEWIEMSEDPATFVAGVLAIKIIKLNEHIEYLERRLDHVSTNITTFFTTRAGD